VIGKSSGGSIAMCDLGIEIDDAIEIAEKIEVSRSMLADSTSMVE
jgi:hypothetical protein